MGAFVRLRFSTIFMMLASAASFAAASPLRAQSLPAQEAAAPIWAVQTPIQTQTQAAAPVAAPLPQIEAAAAPVVVAPALEPSPAAARSDVFLALEPITIYGSRSEAALRDVPANIAVIDGATLERQGVSDMMQLTRNIPGVVTGFQTSATDPFSTYSGFTIRGVGGNRVQMLVDGSRVPERVGDGTRDYLDFNFVKQVDILRGPGSVLWGADALGGVVAMETIDPEDILRGRDQGARARLAYGGVTDSIDGNAIVAHRLGPDLQLMLGAAHGRSEEMRLSKARIDGGGLYACNRRLDLGATPCDELNPMDRRTTRVLGKVVYEPSDAHRLEFSADFMRRTTDVDYNNNLSPTLRSYDRRQVTERQRYGLEHTWTPDSTLVDQVVTRLSYAPQSVDRRGVQRTTPASGFNQIIRDFTTVEEDFLELDVQARKDFALGGTEHELTFGFDGDLTRLDYTRYNLTETLSGPNAGTVRTRPTGFPDARTRRADLYVQDQIGLFGERLEVTPGLRLATYEIDPRPKADYPGDRPAKSSSEKLLGSIGALWRLNDSYSLYGKIAQGFKMPTSAQLYTASEATPTSSFIQVPNPDLRPEHAISYEVGVRGKLGRGDVSVNGFYSDYDDFIQGFYTVPGAAAPMRITSVNLNTVKIWGVEAEADLRLTENLSANAALSWQRGEQQSAPGADWLPHNVAPLTATLGLTYDIPAADLTLQAIGSFAQGVKRTSAPNLFKPGGYAVFDAHASWRATDNATLNFSVTNLFDKRYFLTPFPYTYEIPPSAAVANTNPLDLQTQAGREFRVSLDVEL